MEIVTGTFDTRLKAEGVVRQAHSLGIRNDRIALLTPDMSEAQIERSVSTTETEAPGEGKALGGVVGGAMGVAGGGSLAAAAISLFVPGVGPVIAGGLIGAAIIGAGGTAAGMAVGEALDQSLVEGLPSDELYVYENELRHGRSVVIVFTEEEESVAAVRNILEDNGATNIDEARESWWSELRAAEEANYNSSDRDFSRDEAIYRHGFETAQHPNVRGKRYEEASTKIKEFCGDVYKEGAFRRGYERGLAYYERVVKKA